MKHEIFPDLACRFAHSPRVKLTLFWSLGLCAGSAFAVLNTGPLEALMGSAVSSRVSIVGLLTAFVVPFVVSAVCLRYHVLILIYLTAFCKAMALGFCSCAVYRTYGSAAWLVRCLLLFPDTVCCTALLWLWLSSGSERESRFHTVLCGIVIAVAGLVDYLVVSPFLAGLWNFN